MEDSDMFEEFRDPIYEVVMEYHHSFTTIARDAMRYGVLVEDVPAGWAGLVRFVGYMPQLCHLLEENWGDASEQQQNNDGSPSFGTWVEYVETIGRKLEAPTWPPVREQRVDVLIEINDVVMVRQSVAGVKDIPSAEAGELLKHLVAAALEGQRSS